MGIFIPGEDGARVEPVEKMLLVANYRNFQDDLRANFCVYHLFPGRNLGLYREFKCDMPSFVFYGRRNVKVGDSSRILRGEGDFINRMTEVGVQCISSEVGTGISYLLNYKILSEFHQEKFYEKNKELSGLVQKYGADGLRQFSSDDLRKMFDLPSKMDSNISKLFDLCSDGTLSRDDDEVDRLFNPEYYPDESEENGEEDSDYDGWFSPDDEYRG